MKPNPNQRRSRGRSGSSNSGGGNNSGRRGGRNQNFESNGPEVKVRGSAQQVLDKYLQLARDAQSVGDRVKAEGYLQYAEHYYRIVNEAQENAAPKPSAEQGGERNNERSSQGAKEPDAKESGEKREARPTRRPRRNSNTNANAKSDGDASAPAKNEATLAAEAASANAVKADKPDNADKAEATVESTVPAAAPSDEAEDATAVGE